jgi:hypothetical protein
MFLQEGDRKSSHCAHPLHCGRPMLQHLAVKRKSFNISSDSDPDLFYGTGCLRSAPHQTANA